MDVIAPSLPKRRAILVVLSATFAALFAGSGSAAAPGPVARLVERDGLAQVTVRLLRDRERDHVGLLFDLAPGWHLYWRSPGDTGLAPEIIWDLPGRQPGPIQWPAPRAFEAGGSEPGAASYGYEGRVLLASAFERTGGADGLSSNLRGERLAVDGDVLVCQHECVPAVFRLERGAEPLPGLGASQERALFAEFAARVPGPPAALGVELSAAWSQSAIRPGDRFSGAIAVRSCTGAKPGCLRWRPEPIDGASGPLFPDDLESLSLRAAGISVDASDPSLYWVELSGEVDADGTVLEERFTGVLSLAGPGEAHRFVEIDVPLPPAAAAASEVIPLVGPWPSSATAALGGLGILRALLLALLGGLVLNLMPCVLPVLAIKVFSVSEMARAPHVDRREPLRHAIAYTTGIVASMLVLATLVVLLRAAGHSVGWGFQFQEPVYIAAISAVLVAFALNLFGTFEIRGGTGPLADLGRQATGAHRSFFEGLLAVALATPCSAPFLGTALGFAFASPPPVILGIFAAIGLGLAAPFALVALVPSWARFVPRSGAWMQHVRSALGFTLLATVLWLLWLFGGSAGSDGMLRLIALLLALAFGLWCFGSLQRSEHPRTTWATGAGVLLLAVAGLNTVASRVEGEAPSTNEYATSRGHGNAWSPWSKSAVEQALAGGSPVFVRFTADWCITCKVNEHVALGTSEVQQAFELADFVLLVADWTHRDEMIRRELSRHGRAGVPLYLVYQPEAPDKPRLLRELLTPGEVLEAIAEARAAGDGATAKALSRQPRRDDELREPWRKP